MIEFIVWDKEYKRFIPWGYDTRDKGCFTAPVNPSFPSFQYIGKKDINNNKIYADSSIVEFEYRTINKEKLVGIFTYSAFNLCYFIELINDSRSFAFESLLMENFKIIDTIQENRLGLIK